MEQAFQETPKLKDKAREVSRCSSTIASGIFRCYFSSPEPLTSYNRIQAVLHVIDSKKSQSNETKNGRNHIVTADLLQTLVCEIIFSSSKTKKSLIWYIHVTWCPGKTSLVVITQGSEFNQ